MPNAYQSPDGTSADKEKRAHLPDSAGLSDDARGNIGLTMNIIKFASVLAALMSLVPIGQAWFAFRYYGVPDGWTWWHTLICLRVVYSPCWWLLATMMWKYATSLSGLKRHGSADIEHVIERQAKMWLAGGLLLFVMLIGVALEYVASFGSSMSSPSAAQSPAAPTRIMGVRLSNSEHASTFDGTLIDDLSSRENSPATWVVQHGCDNSAALKEG